jgi:dienelactone hydrolase
VDDSPQFCRAYLPADYTPARRWPLVVNLHGYNPPNPPYVRWWSVDQRHVAAADQYGFIEIDPHGRGNTSYLGIGDIDVLRCIETAKGQFAVDENRVYLTGYSMGGGGTWHVGTRHPELFGGIAPIYGGWDYHVRRSEEELAALTPRQRFIEERRSSFAQADALLTTPLFVNHGDADVLVDVSHSRYAVRMLQRWGYDVQYWEHPGLGHGALGCEDALFRWFLDHPRDRHAARVRVRSGWLKSAAAHWVRVQQQADPYAFILADAEMVGPNTVRLDTENALEVTLSPGGPLVAEVMDWRGFLGQEEDQEVLRRLRRHGRTGRPLGSPEFVTDVERRLARILAPHRPGPRPHGQESVCHRNSDNIGSAFEPNCNPLVAGFIRICILPGRKEVYKKR